MDLFSRQQIEQAKESRKLTTKEVYSWKNGPVCKKCLWPKKIHPKVMGERICDLVLLKDRPLNDGSGRVITVEGFPEDMPRTKENNLRWVHVSRSPIPVEPMPV